MELSAQRYMRPPMLFFVTPFPFPPKHLGSHFTIVPFSVWCLIVKQLSLPESPSYTEWRLMSCVQLGQATSQHSLSIIATETVFYSNKTKIISKSLQQLTRQYFHYHRQTPTSSLPLTAFQPHGLPAVPQTPRDFPAWGLGFLFLLLVLLFLPRDHCAHPSPPPNLLKYHLSHRDLHTLSQTSQCPQFLLYSFVHSTWYNLLIYPYTLPWWQGCLSLPVSSLCISRAEKMSVT